MKELTITDLATQLNALEASAQSKGLTTYFALNDWRVTGTVYERREYLSNLEKVFSTEQLDNYDPKQRKPELMAEKVETVINEMSAFILAWRGHDIERISKEINDLETKLTSKREELAEAQQKKDAETEQGNGNEQ